MRKLRVFVPVFLLCLSALVVGASAVDSAPVVSGATYATFEPIVEAITGAFNFSTIVTGLSGAVGLAIGFVFFWWLARKVKKIVMSGVLKGKLKI